MEVKGQPHALAASPREKEYTAPNEDINRMVKFRNEKLHNF
jgi:hypothetical protein